MRSLISSSVPLGQIKRHPVEKLRIEILYDHSFNSFNVWPTTTMVQRGGLVLLLFYSFLFIFHSRTSKLLLACASFRENFPVSVELFGML